ncbi:unnamed protein product [Symbiodinium natans]|uniref:Uncharacterized protein n=1 Tax=Symbiodinium natans TaxID=878477 RepID=A0A812JZB4_9DINO|nr:unnamed protein product [Symbiodinium natans]
MVPSRFPELHLSFHSNERPYPDFCWREPSCARAHIPKQRRAVRPLLEAPKRCLEYVTLHEGLADQVHLTPEGLKFHSLESTAFDPFNPLKRALPQALVHSKATVAIQAWGSYTSSVQMASHEFRLLREDAVLEPVGWSLGDDGATKLALLAEMSGIPVRRVHGLDARALPP